MPYPVLPSKLAKGLMTPPAGGYKLWFKNASPTLMVVGGCAAIVGGVIFACNATLKADSVLDEIEAEVDKVNHVKEIADEETYSEQDYQKDLTIVYFT